MQSSTEKLFSFKIYDVSEDTYYDAVPSVNEPWNNFGFNVQTGIHLPQLMGWKTSQDIVPHFMFERVRTQDKMPVGTDPDKSRNRNAIFTFGVAYLPIPEVALKMDHTHIMLQNNTSTDEFNLGVAYMY